MNYRLFACGKLVALTFLTPTIIIIPEIIFCLFAPDYILENWTFVLVFYLIQASLFAILHSNAFKIVTVSEKSISNKHIELDWTDIGYVGIFTVDLFKYRKLPIKIKPINILCFSRRVEDNALWSTNCVCISMSKRNMERISLISKGKSKVLDDFFELNDKFNVNYDYLN